MKSEREADMRTLISKLYVFKCHALPLREARAGARWNSLLCDHVQRNGTRSFLPVRSRSPFPSWWLWTLQIRAVYIVPSFSSCCFTTYGVHGVDQFVLMYRVLKETNYITARASTKDYNRVIQSSLIILLQVLLMKTDGKCTRRLTLYRTNPFSKQMLAFRDFLNTTCKDSATELNPWAIFLSVYGILWL